ncbi:ABC transporter substrate-binding protein [Azomonas agilis]|uniref:ABC transporter substrate-binding protein n=1 Tax=Azomonas agilis TaxID=116849 RepID=UPI0014792E75|nr:ABC transporter substrate-binding protein [Azomonas agilis]
MSSVQSVWRFWAFSVGLTLLLLATSEVMAKSVTDMLGRTVEVPDRIERVVGAAPPITSLMFALAPEALVGLNMPFAAGDERFIGTRLPALPVVGGILGHGRRMQPESILELRPDVALALTGSIVPQASIDETIRLFKQVGVPVVFVTLDTLADWPQAFQFVGQLLGKETRAQELGSYITEAMARVTQAVADIPESSRKRVYYAQGRDGLATECDTSFHAQGIRWAGGYNVHRCPSSSYMGMEAVSLEQVLAYAPQVVIVQDNSFLPRFQEHGPWRRLQAQVLTVPKSPLNWLDRPASFMLALGIQWLTHELYPERFPLDLKGTTQAFYARFFGVTLTDADFDSLFAVQGEGAAGSMHQHSLHHHGAE